MTGQETKGEIGVTVREVPQHVPGTEKEKQKVSILQFSFDDDW
jgi:hypothetical protein